MKFLIIVLRVTPFKSCGILGKEICLIWSITKLISRILFSLLCGKFFIAKNDLVFIFKLKLRSTHNLILKVLTVLSKAQFWCKKMAIWGWGRGHWNWIFWIKLVVSVDKCCSLTLFSLGFEAKMLLVSEITRLVLLDGHIFCILILIYNQKVLMLELIWVSLEFILCFD